jgi:exosortase/archaeosortase family protein
MNSQKRLFKDIFIVTAIILSILPVLVTSSAILTDLFEKMRWYVWLQEMVVPFESRHVAVLVRVVGIEGKVVSGANFSMVLVAPGGHLIPVSLEWNCLGWQSMILLAITFATGLRGNFSRFSKAEVIVFGVVGTFLSNLFRMAVVVALAYYWNSLAAKIIHDYFAMFVALVWMIFFWWFSYSYVLETKAQERI